MTNRKPLIIGLVSALVGFGLGVGAGFALSYEPPLAVPVAGGAYFCCDSYGRNCVLSVDGDCGLPVQWCSETGHGTDGTVICVEW